MTQKVIWHLNMAPSFLWLHIITNEKTLKFTQIGRLLSASRASPQKHVPTTLVGIHTCWYIYLGVASLSVTLLATTEQWRYFDCFIDSGKERDQSNMSKTINFIYWFNLVNCTMLVNNKPDEKYYEQNIACINTNSWKLTSKCCSYIGLKTAVNMIPSFHRIHR